MNRKTCIIVSCLLVLFILIYSELVSINAVLLQIMDLSADGRWFGDRLHYVSLPEKAVICAAILGVAALSVYAAKHKE